MPKGGPRNRSGPKPDPHSLRATRRAPFRALPSEGYQGEIPPFSLPLPTKRELAIWEKSWRLPQAAVWARESWRIPAVEQWVRWTVRAESKKCPANVIAAAIRLADQIGLTPAGLRENGWTIAADELDDRRRDAAESDNVEVSDFVLKVADGGDA